MFRRRSRQYDRYRDVNQGISTPAASAAAAAASSQRLSSSAAAEALRRHSLTQTDQDAMARFDAGAARGGMRRSASMTLAESQYARSTSFSSRPAPGRANSLTRRNSLTTQTTVNRDESGRTMSLTTTTVRQLGSFELVSTKETPVRAPRSSQSHGSLRQYSGHNQSPSFQESLNSFDSELSVVREEPELFDHIVDPPVQSSPQRGREKTRVQVASLPTVQTQHASNGTTTTSPLVNVTTALDACDEGEETEGDTTMGSYAEPETTAEQITDLEQQLRLENLPDGSVQPNGEVQVRPDRFLSTEQVSRSRSRSPMKPALRERKDSTASERERRNTHVSFETAHTEEYVYDAYDYDDYDEANASAASAASANGSTRGASGPNGVPNGSVNSSHITAAAVTAAAKAKQQRDVPSPAKPQAQRRAAAAAAARIPKQSSAAARPTARVSTAAAVSASTHSNAPAASTATPAPVIASTPDSEGDSVYSDAEDEFEKEQRRPSRQSLEQKQLNGRPNPPADSPAARALAAAAAISNSNGHLPTSIPRRSSLRNSQIYKPREPEPLVEDDDRDAGHHYRVLLDDSASITSDSSFKREHRSTAAKAESGPRTPQRMATTLRTQERRGSLTGRPKREYTSGVPGTPATPSTPTGGFRSYSLRNQPRPDPTQLLADANAHVAASKGNYDLAAPPSTRPGGGLYSLRGDSPNTRAARRTSVGVPTSAPTTPAQATRFVSRFSRDSDSDDEEFTAAINSITSNRPTETTARARTGFKSMFMAPNREDLDVKVPQRYSSAPETGHKRSFFKRLFSRG